MSNNNVSVDAVIGFVESFAVMGDCQEGLKARKEIEAKRDLAGREIQDESKKFEKAKNDYISKSTTMSDAARAKEEKQLIRMEQEIKNLVAEKEEELKLDMQVATENLAQNLEASVTKLAKNENLDIVFDKMTGRAMYVSDKFDYTDKAIKEMNKTYEVKLAQNKQAEAPTKLAENKTAPAAKKISA
jgi:Skp family chaperone for outer membrane proteins